MRYAFRWDPKVEAIRLWEGDPCGYPADGARETSASLFEAIDRDRYAVYAPWLDGAVRFDRFSGKRVIEVGCGMGSDLARFARAGAVAIGLDLAPRHLRISRQRLEHEQVASRLVRADAETLPFADGSIDVVYSFGVLHHTPEIESAIDEIWRVLRPGGVAIIGLYHRNSVFYWFFTIFLRGIVRGVLFRDGYRRLLADIESHPHSDALPLVRVYGRPELERLLSRFDRVTVQTHHLAAEHFSRLLAPLVRCVSRTTLERYGRRWGWYVVAEAWK